MASRQRTKTRTTAMGVIASAAALLASCGGSPRTIAVGAPQQVVAPGYDSPQAAVAGYLQGYEKNDAKNICAYVAPPQQGYCGFLIGAKPHNSLGTWHLGNSLMRADKAVVVVLTDRWCISKICLANGDPNKGLPAHPQGFENAFDRTSNWLPAVSVVRIKGKWYVAMA